MAINSVTDDTYAIIQGQGQHQRRHQCECLQYRFHYFRNGRRGRCTGQRQHGRRGDRSGGLRQRQHHHQSHRGPDSRFGGRSGRHGRQHHCRERCGCDGAGSEPHHCRRRHAGDQPGLHDRRRDCAVHRRFGRHQLHHQHRDGEHQRLERRHQRQRERQHHHPAAQRRRFHQGDHRRGGADVSGSENFSVAFAGAGGGIGQHGKPDRDGFDYERRRIKVEISSSRATCP